MSVTLSSKSGEVGEDSVNLMASDNRPKHGWRSHIAVWWIGAVAVCLGFLLLILILVVAAQNSKALGHQDSKGANLIYSLTADRDTLRDERDQLKVKSINLTEEIKVLQTQCNAMTVSRDTLQEEVNRLNLSRKDSKAIDHQDSTCANLIHNLTADKDTLRDERDQLKVKSINLTEEIKVLQTQYNAVAVSRDTLQEEVNRLNLSRKNESCQQRWMSFGGKCYYFSASGLTKTWESSRLDCQERGADLVVITTKEELDFIVHFYDRTWIGLSDKDQEGKWKWVDGTADLLSNEFWAVGEPNNDRSNEDCAEVVRSIKKFNDVPCQKRLSWACEE